jgi:hypothetical protein
MLKQVIEEVEATGGDPLGDLAHQLMQALTERRTTLETIQRDYAI